MKKKIKDLTFYDKLNICKKYYKDDCWCCPLQIALEDVFTGKTLKWVCNKDLKYDVDLDEEIEVEE